MKKFLAGSILILLICIVIGWFFKAPIMSMYLSKMLKTPVSISNITLSKSQMKIQNLQMKNPRGYKKELAYTCREIEVNYKWDKLRKDPSLVDEMVLKDNYLYIDCNNALCSSNNWTEIVSKISEKEQKVKETREVIISKLLLKNLQVEINGMDLIPGIKKNIVVDHLEFNNVSSKEGFPTQQLIAVIFKNAGLFDYLKEVLNKTRILDKYLKPFNLFSLDEKQEQLKKE